MRVRMSVLGLLLMFISVSARGQTGAEPNPLELPLFPLKEVKNAFL